jgi:hypothetical protein
VGARKRGKHGTTGTNSAFSGTGKPEKFLIKIQTLTRKSAFFSGFGMHLSNSPSILLLRPIRIWGQNRKNRKRHLKSYDQSTTYADQAKPEKPELLTRFFSIFSHSCNHLTHFSGIP